LVLPRTGLLRLGACCGGVGVRTSGDRSRRAKGKAGWQYLFVAIDDASRLGFASLYPDETADSALAFLDELVRFYGLHGVTVERVLTDG
jgi:TorA maturation chaperone TorD